ncbi:hypothetical protein Peetri_00122 [Pseudomonas phage vB_PpuM-Peetri]
MAGQPANGGAPSANTEVSAIRLSPTQVIAIVVAVFSIYFFVEDRYAKQAPVSADIDALKKTVISFVSTQTKFNRETTEQFRNQQSQISELYSRFNATRSKDGDEKEKMVAVPPPSSLSPSAASNAATTIPEVNLPERLFTDSKGDPVVEFFPTPSASTLELRGKN